MDYTELAGEFLQSMFLLQKSRPQKKIAGSMQGEIFVLYYLLRQGSDIVPGEISKIMCISSARTAAALNNLERKGLVTREIDKGDRRRILISLTSAGRELAREHQKNVVCDTVKMLRLLGENDALEYIRIIKKLAALCENGLNGNE